MNEEKILKNTSSLSYLFASYSLRLSYVYAAYTARFEGETA